MVGVEHDTVPSAPPVSRAARLTATALLIAGLGVAALVAVAQRPVPQASPSPTEPATTTAPVTTTPAATVPAPATTATVATTATPVAPTSTSAVTTTTVPTTTAVPPAGDAWWRSAVLATTDAGVVEVWTPAGRRAAVDGCAGVPGCYVMSAVLLADAVAVVRGGGLGVEIVRLPFDGRASEVLVPAGGPIDALTAGADGASLRWLTRPPTGAAVATLHRWPAPDVPVDAGSAFQLAPDPTGTRLAWTTFPTYGADGAMDEPGRVVVRDERTGEQRVVTFDRSDVVSSLAWTPDGTRLVVQLADEARVVEVPAAGELRVGRALPFVATCVDTDARVLGVRRIGEGRAMRHVLGEAALPSGTVRSWDVTLGDGVLACRGDGAAVVVTTGVTPGELAALRVLRADGRDTLLGRGYAALGGGLGRSWFSSMSCGGEGS